MIVMCGGGARPVYHTAHLEPPRSHAARTWSSDTSIPASMPCQRPLCDLEEKAIWETGCLRPSCPTLATVGDST